VYCLNQSGECKWTFKADSSVFATPFMFSYNAKDGLRTKYGGLDERTSSASASKVSSYRVLSGNTNISSAVGHSDLDCEAINVKLVSETLLPTVENQELVCGEKADQDSVGFSDSASIHSPVFPYDKFQELVCIFSTKGTMFFLDATSGERICQSSLPGEVFSSPICFDGKVVVGCRDNYVYAFQIL
jgi:outer membrane protein assembly factor BamB